MRALHMSAPQMPLLSSQNKANCMTQALKRPSRQFWAFLWTCQTLPHAWARFLRQFLTTVMSCVLCRLLSTKLERSSYGFVILSDCEAAHGRERCTPPIVCRLNQKNVALFVGLWMCVHSHTRPQRALLHLLHRHGGLVIQRFEEAVADSSSLAAAALALCERRFGHRARRLGAGVPPLP